MSNVLGKPGRPDHSDSKDPITWDCVGRGNIFGIHFKGSHWRASDNLRFEKIPQSEKSWREEKKKWRGLTGLCE